MYYKYLTLRYFHTTKPEVAGACTNLPFASGTQNIPGAELVGTKERTTPMDPLFGPRLFWIKALVWTLRVSNESF